MDGNQDKIVFNESKPFDKQVDDVLSGADTASSHLEVLKVTPPLLRMVGVPNLPILMTARHVKTITQESGSDSANYHGLGVELIKKLPELISDPVMIMDSISPDAKAKNSIVIVTQMLDKENRPVIGAIRLAGRGNDLNGFEISANIMTSAYGKDNFQSFIERNIEQGSVLYVDKAKSQVLFETPGIQFPDNFESLDFDIIIRKTNAFVNREEEKKPESTEKNEGSMKADTNNATAQSARERVQQVRDEMVKTLLEHIEKNPTDWQSGWNNIAAGAPYNGKTNTAYRGMNALYLAFLGAARGYKDTRWVTFNQAKELGASVKKGEKSAPVIFFEFYDRATKKAFDSRTVKDMTEEEKAAYLKENVYAVMKYSSVFNAEQCHNFPERKDVAMSEEERANQNVKIEAIIANSSAPVRYDGGSRAYYSPGTDSIHLPIIQAFDTMQDYYATALHEIAHSTGHESRLNRDLSGGFGSKSYAKEELRAELACVFMQMEQGIQLNGKHITNHAAYLNSWLEAAKKDTSVFFKAAADAQKIADYVADNYLQAAAVAGTADENVAQEQSEEQPERNPMADYLRAERLTHSAVTDAGERTWEQENIRDWYTSAYPNDEAGLDIHPNATFKDLREELNLPNPISVYGMLGEDSIVRERTFTRLAELSGSSYASIYSAFLGETAEQKLENARALAKRLAIETGEPYVTIEWSEHQALNSYDVMSLSEADKKLATLDAQEDKNEGYFKTKLHIDYIFEGDHNAYECCRFDIGSEGGGLVHHIDEFLKYDTFLDAEERQQAENALKYFKVHSDLSSMVDTAIASGLSEQEQFDVQSYVLLARGAVNSAVPFSTYKLPETSAFEQGDNTEHQFMDKTRYGSPINGIAEHPVGSGKFVAIIDNSEQKEDAFPDQYPPSFIIAHDYNPQSGEWQTGAFGFSDYDEARDYLIEHYGFDIGQSLEAERSEQEKLINDAASWYSMERPQLKLQDCLDAVREMDAETIREYAEQYRAYLDSAAEFMNDTVDRSAYQVKTSYMYQAYTELQNNNPDAFIVCRIGGDGLYQVLGEKAKIVAEQCNLPLESRDVGEPNQVPMVSIPIADAYPYIDKLREIGKVVIEVEGRRLNLEQRTATELMREQPSDSSNSEQEVKEYAQTLREYDLITGKPERSEEDYITQAQNEIAEFDGERQATDSNQRFYYPINEEASRRAQEANSYSDYKEGSATAEYRRNVDGAIEIATKQKKLVDPMYHARIDALLDSYAKRLAANINEGNAIDARMPSYLITGGGNFNVGKKQKQNAARDRNHQEWQEIQSILDRIRSTGRGGISSDDPNSIQKLTAKLESLEKSQETMKAVNAYYRKNKTLEGCPALTAEQISELKADMKRFPHLEGKPYPTWSLSNNNAEIRRVKERIEELTKRQEGGFVGWDFNGGEVKANIADNRLQIFFEEKPDEDTRSELKQNGFKWSPKASAWQRQLTPNAYYAADRIEAIQPLSGEKPTDLQRAHVKRQNVAVAENSSQADNNLIAGEAERGKEEYMTQARNEIADLNERQQIEEPEQKSNKIPHYELSFKLDYGNEMLLTNALKELGYSRDTALYEINERNDNAAVENREGRWVNGIRYLGADGKSFQGFYGRAFNGITLEATDITGFTTSGLSNDEANVIADVVRDFGVDVAVKEIPMPTAAEEKLTLEEARNAMLDAQELRQNHYAVRIEYVPYTDPEDGYESEEPAQVIYTVSQTGRIDQYKAIPLDSDVFSSDLPHGRHISYEPVEYEELEEIAQKVREPIQTFKDILRAELEAGTERRRSDAYYDQRVEDILDEHYRTEYGLFERNIENPKYLSGKLYAEQSWHGEKIMSLTQDKNGRNIAIIARSGGAYSVAEDYHTDDGRRWGAVNTFENLKAAEEFRVKNYPTEAERESSSYNDLAESKSPLGQEYAKVKGEYSDSIVFYRIGDFYEVLGADAERAASALDLTLTGRTIGTAERVPMCGVPLHAIEQYVNILANKGENVVVADGADVKAYQAKIDLTEKRLREYADTLRRNDLEVGNTARTDEEYRNQARAEIAAYEQSDEYKQAMREDYPNDFIDDSPYDMIETPQNKPERAQEPKREWLNIELPNGTVGGQYGERTMIKMPKGEFSYFAFYAPTKMLEGEGGKTQLRVASDYVFRLNNDGRQVELTGRELADSFAGKTIGKEIVRVAPSREAKKTFANLEKNIPEEFKALPNWCVYRVWQKDENKRGKVIKSAVTGEGIHKDNLGNYNANDFTDFDTALKYAKKEGFAGLSLLLDKQNGITCIDLDKCVKDVHTGEFKERATKLIKELSGTYMERSTSGNGIHIFLKDDILKNGQYKGADVNADKGDLEVLEDKRIISMTGDMISKTNALTRAGSAATVYLRQELGERKKVSTTTSPQQVNNRTNLGDKELIRWIQSSKQGSKFNDLYNGRGVSGDKSADDGKLAHMLLYFNGGDKEQAFRIMRESGLNRPDKPDSYYRHTIDSMNSKIETYARPPKSTAGVGNNRTSNKGAQQ